jgi:hypothetical protein
MMEFHRFIFKDRAIQNVMSRLDIESDVRSVSWQTIQN